MSWEPALEFYCAECGEHIISISHSHFPLCAMCVHMPGWFKIAEFRSVISPDHNGDEPALPGDSDEARP